MNYKKILTEEAAEQFKKEGATTAVITLYNKDTDKVIRDVEVQLEDEDRCFSIAGRTPEAEAAMTKCFCGDIVNGERWFPFALFQPTAKDIEQLLKKVAKAAETEPSHLKWSYIIDH